MIAGVKIKKLKVHRDVPDLKQKVKPGYLMEVLRADDPFFKKFGQTTFTVAYPGTIKAFHWHRWQDDLWFVATGKAKIVLYDRRKNSKTYRQKQIIEAGEDNWKLIVIPRGVVHGYKVVGRKPVLLFYHTTRPYNKNKPDEERIPPDDPEIGIDWKKIK